MANMSANDVVEIRRGEESSCKIHLFGATVVSWINNGEEHIFVSSKALFDNKKAIRGGIPLVFPNFGPWDLGPQHGFARISRWEAGSPSEDADGNPFVTFILKESEKTLEMWKFKFTLEYRVTLLPGALKTDLTITNTDTQEFDFTCLLHSYLKVPDVTKTTISGLQGLSYVDKDRNAERFTETRDLVSVIKFEDRVYENSPDEHIISGVTGGKSLRLQKKNLPDTVVWNPWKEKAAAMADFGDEDYPFMICVEAGYVSKRKLLSAGDKFETSQILSVQ